MAAHLARRKCGPAASGAAGAEHGNRYPAATEAGPEVVNKPEHGIVKAPGWERRRGGRESPAGVRASEVRAKVGGRATRPAAAGPGGGGEAVRGGPGGLTGDYPPGRPGQLPAQGSHRS